jgi:hypothetical protein
MKRMLLLLAFSAAAFAQDGFQPLFNGKNLDGWDGDPRMWSVRDGMIVGHTEGVTMTDNSFLISKQPYRNFILRAEMKLRNHNSGIQFRSEALPTGWCADIRRTPPRTITGATSMRKKGAARWWMAGRARPKK